MIPLIPGKFGPVPVKKLLKINHENTKVLKHETRHRNGNSYIIKLLIFFSCFRYFVFS